MRVPQKVTKTIEVECWDCGIEAHRHRKESAAEDCILRQEVAARPQPSQRDQLEKKVGICRSIINGATLKEAGAAYNVSGTYARTVLQSVIRRASMMRRHKGDKGYWFGSRDIKEMRDEADEVHELISLFEQTRAKQLEAKDS